MISTAYGDSGYRNGTRAARLTTAESVIEHGASELDGRTEPFGPRIREQLGQRTQALEELNVEMCARGLSTRDIGSVFRDSAGQPMLSRTAVPNSYAQVNRATRSLARRAAAPTALSTSTADRYLAMRQLVCATVAWEPLVL